MEKRKPLVKKLTQAFTFTLCCVLCLGVLPLNTLALEQPDEISILASGVVPTGGYIKVMGEDYTNTVDGYQRLDLHRMNYNIANNPLQVDMNGNPYLEIQILAYSTLTNKPYIEVFEDNAKEPTIYELSYGYGEDLDIDINGALTNLNIILPNSATSGTLVEYICYLTFDNSDPTPDPTPDPNRFITIDFYNQQNFSNADVILRGSNNFKAEIVENLILYGDSYTFKADTDIFEPYTSDSGLNYYDIVLNNIGNRTYISVEDDDYNTMHINSQQILYDGQVIEVYLPLNITDYTFSVGVADGTRVSGVTVRVYYSAGEAFSNGYQKGLEDGYQRGLRDGRNEGGSANSFLSIITDPISALFGITIVQINGITITLGAVFFTQVGIILLLIYLKYFAGG